jgi:hypothetical protein
MHMILRYPSGRLVDGILLAIGPGRMRFVVKRRNETLELCFKDGQWMAENGEHIELEALLADDKTNPAELPGMGYRTSTATH